MASFDLPAILRERREKRLIRRRVVILNGIRVAPGFVATLRRLIMRVPDFYAERVRTELMPVYEAELAKANTLRDAAPTASTARQWFKDDAPERIRALMDQLGDDAMRVILAINPDLSNWIVSIDRWHSQRWSANIKRQTGFNPDFLVGSMAARAEVRAFRQWAASLITDVSDTARRRISAEVYEGFISQTPRRAVEKEIQRIISSSRKRAKLIARDQANKLSGKLDELRSRDAGVARYRWRTAEDERVRPTHRRNNRKIFSWKRAPRVTGHPRTEINCRCTAEPYIPLLAEVEDDLGL